MTIETRDILLPTKLGTFKVYATDFDHVSITNTEDVLVNGFFLNIHVHLNYYGAEGYRLTRNSQGREEYYNLSAKKTEYPYVSASESARKKILGVLIDAMNEFRKENMQVFRQAYKNHLQERLEGLQSNREELRKKITQLDELITKTNYEISVI